MKCHRDLFVWQKSVDLVTEIYTLTDCFPKSELYCMVNQIRRSAISIPSNIAEGAGRCHKNEFVQFLYYAMGSLSELETQLIISENLGFVKNFEFHKIEEIRKMINGLIYSIRN